eukprot:566110-Pyramimonas_sp.AAC.1
MRRPCVRSVVVLHARRSMGRCRRHIVGHVLCLRRWLRSHDYGATSAFGNNCAGSAPNPSWRSSTP